MLWQPPLAERYTTMSDEQIIAAITARKRECERRERMTISTNST